MTELDRMLAERILGWPQGAPRMREIPRLTSDPRAAWQLVEHLTRDPQIEFDLRVVGGGHTFAAFTNGQGDVFGADHPSTPIAICLAAARLCGIVRERAACV